MLDYWVLLQHILRYGDHNNIYEVERGARTALPVNWKSVGNVPWCFSASSCYLHLRGNKHEFFMNFLYSWFDVIAIAKETRLDIEHISVKKFLWIRNLMKQVLLCDASWQQIVCLRVYILFFSVKTDKIQDSDSRHVRTSQQASLRTSWHSFLLGDYLKRRWLSRYSEPSWSTRVTRTR